MAKKKGRSAVATNRKARHDYTIEEVYEAGIALKGNEVKSIREGRVSLKDSHGIIRNGELFILNMHISPYSHDSSKEYDPIRTRKLLLHKREIKRLIGKTQQKGYTLVPLKLYFKRGYVKIEMGLGKGKRLFDKRREIAKRDAQRDMQRELKDRSIGRTKDDR